MSGLANKMFLAQNWVNRIIFMTILVDAAAGYLVKNTGLVSVSKGFGLLYILNVAVLIAVYRFWKVPLFEWDDIGFVFYGISPFKKTYGAWERVSGAGFRTVKLDGKKDAEFLVVVFLDKGRREVTGLLPMKYVAFADKVKVEVRDFLKKNKVPGL